MEGLTAAQILERMYDLMVTFGVPDVSVDGVGGVIRRRHQEVVGWVVAGRFYFIDAEEHLWVYHDGAFVEVADYARYSA